MAAVPAASASTPVVDHFFFDGAKVVFTNEPMVLPHTGFEESWVVFTGNSTDHSALSVGKAWVKCRYFTDSTSRCRAYLKLGLNGSDAEGAKFGEQTVLQENPALSALVNNVTPIVFSGDRLSGDWASFTSVVLKFRQVGELLNDAFQTDTAANVEVTLSS